jgi:macrolide transport system ATP-binding/permease protein
VHVLKLLHQLHDEGVTVILVTHEPAIGSGAQRLVVVRDGLVVSDERLR